MVGTQESAIQQGIASRALFLHFPDMVPSDAKMALGR